MVADANVMAKKRANANVATTANKPSKKKADTKVVETANETATANVNKPANNTKRAHANVVATADTNVMTTTNKTTNNGRKAHANMMAISKGSNAKRVCTNKATFVDEGNAQKTCINIVATAEAIVTAKNRADANVVATASKLI